MQRFIIFFIGILFCLGMVAGEIVVNFDDIVGSWEGVGVWTRTTDTEEWDRLTPLEASHLVTGDFDADGADDILGVWDFGVWILYACNDEWKQPGVPREGLIWLAAADMNGDGQDDILGSFTVGIWWLDLDTQTWTRLLGTSADMLAAGDIDLDRKDDLVAYVNHVIWVRYSRTGIWNNILRSQSLIGLTCGDMNGDSKADILGSFSDPGGVWLRDSESGDWSRLHTQPANQITVGDLDGDGLDDLLGMWDSAPGIWARYTATGQWDRLFGTSALSFASYNRFGFIPSNLTGIVRDSVTGQGVSGTTITFGNYQATTNSVGQFSIEVGPSCGEISGEWVVYHDEYKFSFTSCLSNIFLDASHGAQINPWISPRSTAGYEKRLLSGRIKDIDENEISDGSYVSINIYSSDWGSSNLFCFYDSGSGGYLVETPTFGDDCLVVFSWFGGHEGSAMVNSVNLSTSTLLNITEQNPDVVNTMLIKNDMVIYILETPYGYVNGSMFQHPGPGSIDVALKINNPYDYPGYWLRQTLYEDNPVMGHGKIYHATSDEIALITNPTVTLPDTSDTLGPDGIGNAASISLANGILSVDPIPNTDAYLFYFDEEVINPNTGESEYHPLGEIMSFTHELTIPQTILTEFSGKNIRVGYMPQTNEGLYHLESLSMHPNQLMLLALKVASLGIENPLSNPSDPNSEGPYIPYRKVISFD